jgi:hypothetical protein
VQSALDQGEDIVAPGGGLDAQGAAGDQVVEPVGVAEQVEEPSSAGPDWWGLLRVDAGPMGGEHASRVIRSLVVWTVAARGHAEQ